MCKDNIALFIVNTEYNKEEIADMFTRDIADLTAVFGFYEYGRIYPMTTAMRSEIDMTDDMLFETATKNMETLLRVNIKPLPDMLMALAPETIINDPFPEAQMIHVISNSKMTYGFAALLYPGMLRKLKEQFGEFYILPSSVHEALIVPAELPISSGRLYETVCMVNKTLSPLDKLSDNVYRYNEELNTIESCFKPFTDKKLEA